MGEVSRRDRRARVGLIARARQVGTEQFDFSADRGTLWAVFPLALAAPGTVPRPGWWCTASDVAAQAAPAFASQRRGTALIFGLILLVCAGLWFYFDRTLTRRVTALLETTRALSAGRVEARARVAGDGEFAQLGEAFNRMAADLQAQESHMGAIFAHALDCIIMIDHDGRILYFNPAAERTFGHTRERVLGRPFAEVIIPPALRAAHQRGMAHHLATGESRVLGRRIEVRAQRADGAEFPVELTITRLPGARVRFVGFLRDITERKHTDRMLAAHRDLLAGIAAVQPLAESLDMICRFVESQAEDMLCSVLVLDADGAHLRHGAAPSLPAAYCGVIDGIAIGAAVGSCGTAAFRREAVIVADIATDPLWENFKAVALVHGLRACWSTPILGSGGAVLGTFAMYFSTVSEPELEHRQLIAMATQTAALALQREHAGVALLQSEERFAKAFRSNPAAMSISAMADGRMIDVNESFVRLFGHERREDLVDRTATELGLWRDPAERERVRAALEEADSLKQFETVFHKKSGELGHALASVERIDLQGEPCLLSTIYDITARKHTEALLEATIYDITARKHTEALLEASLDGLNEGVIVSELDGRPVRWNRAALRMHDYTTLDDCPRQLPELADTFEILASDGGQVPFAQWPFERILRGETVHEWEVRVRHKRAGWVKLMVYNGTLVRDAAGSPLFALLTMINITERRQLEEQLRQSQKMDAIGQLAGGVAHDFNNILTAIILHTELASTHPVLPAEVAETLRAIRSASDRAALLTNQLLLFSRQQVMQLRHFNFSAAVTTSAKLLWRLLGEDVRLELSLHPRPLPVYADEGMIGQVLLNLAVNARDAMPRGGLLLLETTERVVSAEEAQLHPDTAPGRYACLRVQDTGQGIAPEVLPHIFEPFFTTKDVGKGTGLGLATVFGVVHQHRGWIAVESKLAEGTTFSVFLPLVAPPGEVEEPKSAVALHRGSETILLVEDESGVRYTVRALLERHGYRVLVAEHGAAALALWQLEHGKIDLLLTDLVMPGGLGGGELATQLQAELPALKVIVMTGYSVDFAGRDLKLPARQNFLQKPFAPDVLLTTVRAVLDAS